MQAYLVCATPRSGSTLLCELLRATGCAGRPIEHFEVLRASSLPRQPREYFRDLDDPRVTELLEPIQTGTPSTESSAGWWSRILREGLSGNGVWAGKMMWGHTHEFLTRAHELPGLERADLHTAFSELLDDPNFVFVTRADKVAQAVSLWRAVQTQSWRAGDSDAVGPESGETPEGARAPVYSFTAIDHLVRQLQDHEDAWTDWFERSGIDALEVNYDELDATPRVAAARVLRALGLPTSDLPEPPLARQRDELSAGWAERYRREQVPA